MVFKGTTAATAESTPKNAAADIISFSLANKTGGAVTVRVALFYGSTITHILYDYSIPAGESYVYLGERIRVLPLYQIFVSVSGATDYYFTIQ